MVLRGAEHCSDPWPCADCRCPTFPAELYIVTDAVWETAGGVDGLLCVGCLEERLGRALVPEDFPPIPANDDDEVDTVRLRTRKGSGRHTMQLYGIATTAVVDLGRDVEEVAAALGLLPAMLNSWVTTRIINNEFEALLAAEGTTDE